jgi:hypothetical protein
MADRTPNEDDLQAVSDMTDQVWLPGLQLRVSDRVTLEMRNAWLNDRLIAAGMLLLKKHFTEIGGCSDPVLVAALRCHFANQTFVQGLYTGSNHWITASNRNCSPGTVRVYDAMQKYAERKCEKTDSSNISSEEVFVGDSTNECGQTKNTRRLRFTGHGICYQPLCGAGSRQCCVRSRKAASTFYGQLDVGKSQTISSCF